MELNTMTIEKAKAKEMYAEYSAGVEKHPSVRFYVDMAKIAYRAKRGDALLDVPKAIVGAGRGLDAMPKLAICRADMDEVYCTAWDSGHVEFSSIKNNNTRGGLYPTIIVVRDFPELSVAELTQAKWPASPGRKEWGRDPEKRYFDSSIIRYSLVPPIPPRFRPSTSALKQYYVLWEVEKWETKSASKRVNPDPVLLRRINESIYTVVAVWDLTPLETSVMEGVLRNRR